MFPVKRVLRPAASGIILAAIILLFLAPAAHAAADPGLSEAEAKQIASSYGDVRELASKHMELERHAAWNETRRVWEVYWLNPANGRKVISIEVDDLKREVTAIDILPEVYGSILPMLTENEAIAVARDQQRVGDEIADKPDIDPRADIGDDRIWTVSFYDGDTVVADVLIDDGTGLVKEVRIGPQVAWQMARGYDGAFGRSLNKPYVWLPLCLLFLAPFVEVRRPFRMLHLDLLILLSFTVSHYFFNRGEIFTSVPLTYPPLVYLFLRLGYMAVRRPHRRGRAQPEAGVSQAETEAALIVTRPPRPRLHLNFSSRTIFIALMVLLVLRIALNIADSNVVDVGYSGVIGAHRIIEGNTPYGTMPSDDGNGDTYGPLNYLVYVPFERFLPWTGTWNDLPAAHVTAILFDLLAVAGMYFAGRRLANSGAKNENGRRVHAGTGESRRLGLALAWAWAAYPYTTFVLNCNVNDAIVAAFIIWGFVLLRSAFLGGLMLGFATQVKFFPAILGPLWASFPRAFRGWGRRTVFVIAFTIALAVVMPVIFLDEGTLGIFWERSLKWQIGRDSPFSIWGQYPEALAGAQRIGQYILVALAVASYFWPPRKTFLGLAAASAALLVGFELLQTHWFYLYIPWFFPLAIIAMLGWTVRQKEGGGVAAVA